MSLDIVMRLAALHSESADDAISLRLPPEEIGELDTQDIIGDAVDAVFELTESALCAGKDEITLSLETAELLVIALKTRKRPSRRPRKTKDEKARRAAIISYGRQRKAELVAAGVPPGKAEVQASTEAAQQGGKRGDPASPSTILKLMKSSSKKLT